MKLQSGGRDMLTAEPMDPSERKRLFSCRILDSFEPSNSVR